MLSVGESLSETEKDSDGELECVSDGESVIVTDSVSDFEMEVEVVSVVVGERVAEVVYVADSDADADADSDSDTDCVALADADRDGVPPDAVSDTDTVVDRDRESLYVMDDVGVKVPDGVLDSEMEYVTVVVSLGELDTVDVTVMDHESDAVSVPFDVVSDRDCVGVSVYVGVPVSEYVRVMVTESEMLIDPDKVYVGVGSSDTVGVGRVGDTDIDVEGVSGSDQVGVRGVDHVWEALKDPVGVRDAVGFDADSVSVGDMVSEYVSLRVSVGDTVPDDDSEIDCDCDGDNVAEIVALTDSVSGSVGVGGIDSDGVGVPPVSERVSTGASVAVCVADGELEIVKVAVLDSVMLRVSVGISVAEGDSDTVVDPAYESVSDGVAEPEGDSDTVVLPESDSVKDHV